MILARNKKNNTNEMMSRRPCPKVGKGKNDSHPSLLFSHLLLSSFGFSNVGRALRETHLLRQRLSTLPFDDTARLSDILHDRLLLFRNNALPQDRGGDVGKANICNTSGAPGRHSSCCSNREGYIKII